MSTPLNRLNIYLKTTHVLDFCRTLTNGGTKHVWRWTGFNHGLDLVVEYNNLNLTVKRNIPGSWVVTGLDLIALTSVYL